MGSPWSPSRGTVPAADVRSDVTAGSNAEDALFWRREADGFAIEALELAGADGEEAKYRVFLVRDGRRRVLGHVDRAGGYEPWEGRTAGARADEEVLEAVRELRDVVLTAGVMDS